MKRIARRIARIVAPPAARARTLALVRHTAKNTLDRVGYAPPIAFTRFGSDYGHAYCVGTALNHDSVVYSVGVGEEISFDTDLARATRCRIVGIDPTPRSETFITQRAVIPPNYLFVACGLSARTGRQRFYFPKDPTHVSMSLVEDAGAGFIEREFLTLPDLLARLGHTHIALLKLDIEGAEYGVLEAWLRDGYSPPCAQIWVEFHPARAGETPEQTLALSRELCALGFSAFTDHAKGVLFLSHAHFSLSQRQKAELVLCHRLGLSPLSPFA